MGRCVDGVPSHGGYRGCELLWLGSSCDHHRLSYYEDSRVLAENGIHPQVPYSARHHESDVGILEVILPQGIQQSARQLLLRVRYFELDEACRLVEPVDVLLQQKDISVVGPDSFEDPIAVQ